MIEKIDETIRVICSTILFNRHSPKAIQEYYDKLYVAIKNQGYEDFVAHDWTVDKLSNIFGPVRVIKAIESPTLA